MDIASCSFLLINDLTPTEKIELERGKLNYYSMLSNKQQKAISFLAKKALKEPHMNKPRCNRGYILRYNYQL